VQTHLPTNPIQQNVISNNIRLNPSLNHFVQKRLRHFNLPQLAPPVDQNSVYFHVGREGGSVSVENLDGESDVAVLAERVEQEAEVVGSGFGKGVNVVEGAYRLAREAGGYKAAN